MSLTTIRVGGVPEHFNLPIHLAKEKGWFEEKEVQLDWTTYKGGTGQMTKALQTNEVDVCILLTEGIIQSILKGNDARIISNYVTSPLIWGIHTASENPLTYYRDIYDKKYAISRKGSGSHLMAIVDATLKQKSISEEQWVMVNDLEGALTSLQKQKSDVFYWEKFTTKPYVDNGLLKRIGEFLTPWPCFVIAASQNAIDEKAEGIIHLLEVIHRSNRHFMTDPTAIHQVSKRYGIQKDDVEQWYHSTEWATHGWVSNKMLESVCFYLQKANLISDQYDPQKLVWRR